MSGYLDLARRIRAAQERSEEESTSWLASDAATNARPRQQAEAVHLSSDGRRLEAAGFNPKARGGKIIWQRPDTGFYVSQEVALHLLDTKNIRDKSGANTRR
jgi:hypothetical protein